MGSDRFKRSLAGMRFGVLGKGGSGKSTFVVMLSKALHDVGYHVCVLDADSTNLGLPQALGFEQPPNTLLELFGGMVFSGGKVTCPVDDPTPLQEADINLNNFDRNFFVQKDQITLLIAGKIGELGPGAGCDGPVAKIARDISVIQNGDPLVTLIDFKAGFEDSARGAITSLDWAIVIVDPTLAAIEMASELTAMVERIKSFELPATLHLEDPGLIAVANKLFKEAKIKGVLPVLNKIHDPETENYIKRELIARNIEPIGIVNYDPELPIRWLKGLPLNGGEVEPSMHEIVSSLETRVGGGIETEKL